MQGVIGIDGVGRAARKKRASLAQQTFIIGIDEAGRGPLAGPVVVGGVLLRDSHMRARILRGIKDSKKLSARKREKWFSVLVSRPEIEYAVARVWPAVIDRINISAAANLAARRVHGKLSRGRKGVYAVLDGGLFLPDGVSQKTIIKGDERLPVIAAASIIAKVTRDRIMMRLHKKFPEYRFDLHKGYGTRLHKESIRRHGYSGVHRRTFRV